MRKLNLLIPCIVLLLATSCSKREGGEYDGSIEFGALEYYLKADQSEPYFKQGDALGVMGYYVSAAEDWEDYKAEAKPEFMFNQNLSLSGGSWNYSPKAYWPSVPGAKINFYSYYPYSPYSTDQEWRSLPGVKISGPDAMGEPSFDFILSDAADVDLMVAENEGCTEATGPVVLEFSHLLAKLQFKFSVSQEGGFSYLVNGVKLHDALSHARYDWADNGGLSVDQDKKKTVTTKVQGDGYIVYRTDPVLLDDLTMYLLPVEEMGKLHLYLNNDDEPVELDLSACELVAGKVLTVSILINLNDVDFTTSISNWIDGGTVSGGIS